MSFDDLPPQPPIYPREAEEYAESALRLSRAVRERARGCFDVPYGPDYWQKLDVYLPHVPSRQPLPVLVFAHGGAWTHGYKEWMGLMAPAVTASGAILVSVSYRLAPEHRYPVPVDDCVAALAWVHRHIGELGGDPERIGVGGHSAGGHLYACVALHPELSAVSDLPDDVVKACMPISSQLNLVFTDPPPGSGEARIYEMFLARAEDAENASPLHQVKAGIPPFFLTYGEGDFPRIIKSNVEMVEALRQAGGEHACEVLPGAQHFDTALRFHEPSDPWVQRALGWFHARVQKQVPVGR